MSEMIKSEEFSRRKALSLLGLIAAFSLAASSTVLIVSEAEAKPPVWSAVMSDVPDARSGVRNDVQGVQNGARRGEQDARSGARSDVTERSALERAALEIPDVELHGQTRR
jgi:hypothetical protein